MLGGGVVGEGVTGVAVEGQGVAKAVARVW